MNVMEKAPFSAHIPEASNGYVYIRNRNGEEIATCYQTASAAYAAAIVRGLNKLAQEERG